MLRELVWLIAWSEVVLLWLLLGVLDVLIVMQLCLILSRHHGYQDRPSHQAGLTASRTCTLLDLNAIRCRCSRGKTQQTARVSFHVNSPFSVAAVTPESCHSPQIQLVTLFSLLMI